jgi:hypothetical protein
VSKRCGTLAKCSGMPMQPHGRQLDLPTGQQQRHLSEAGRGTCKLKAATAGEFSQSGLDVAWLQAHCTLFQAHRLSFRNGLINRQVQVNGSRMRLASLSFAQQLPMSKQWGSPARLCCVQLSHRRTASSTSVTLTLRACQHWVAAGYDTLRAVTASSPFSKPTVAWPAMVFQVSWASGQQVGWCWVDLSLPFSRFCLCPGGTGWNRYEWLDCDILAGVDCDILARHALKTCTYC